MRTDSHIPSHKHGVEDSDDYIGKKTKREKTDLNSFSVEVDREKNVANEFNLTKAQLLELLEQANVEKQWTQLLNEMSSFIGRNLSTTTKSDIRSAAQSSKPIPESIEGLLTAHNIQLVDPLSTEEWVLFRENVELKMKGFQMPKKTKTRFTGRTKSFERANIHPLVVEVFRECLRRTTSLPTHKTSSPPSSSSSAGSPLAPYTAGSYDLQYESWKDDEDAIYDVPDISIVLKSCRMSSIGSIVMPVVIKPSIAKDSKSLQRAAHQSAGYLMMTLRDRLDISSESNKKLFGFSIGTNMNELSVCCISIENLQMTVLQTGGSPFWPADVSTASCETFGIRVLRTLLACSEEQLGHRFETTSLACSYHGQSLRFKLEGVLGRGGFATVFEASHGGQIFAIKKATQTIVSSNRKHERQIEHMVKEMEMLTRLNQVNSLAFVSSTVVISSALSSSSSSSSLPKGHFPTVVYADWVCDSNQPFLPLLPVGVPLVQYASRQTKRERVEQAALLHKHLHESLAAAQTLGLCHCDLRPDNVVYVPDAGVFMIVDWGLGCESGSLFHGYMGGLPFFHDKIVELSFFGDKHRLKNLVYQPDFDIASAEYVVFAFELGMKHLSVPWADEICMELIQRRQECVQGKKEPKPAVTTSVTKIANNIPAYTDKHEVVVYVADGMQLRSTKRSKKNF